MHLSSLDFRYPNARQYKTVATALVKAYPFLESSSDGGEVSNQKFFCDFTRILHIQGAWIDGIKGKFKRGRRILTSHFDASQDNGVDNSDEEIPEERCSPKRSRQEFDINPTPDTPNKYLVASIFFVDHLLFILSI